MATTGHVKDLLDAYALGCLDKAEAKAVSTHLAGCRECRDELSRWESLTGRLALAAPAFDPPTRLRERVLDLARAKPRGTRWGFLRVPSVSPAVIAAMLVVVFGLAIGDALLLRELRRTDRLEITANSKVIELTATPAAPKAHGTVAFGPDKSAGVLVVSSLGALPAGMGYQLWLLKDDERLSGGVFSVDSSGAAVMLVSAPYPLSQCKGFGITVEPANGSPGPTGEKVLGGTL